MQKLREYQERSISELRQCFKKGKKRVVETELEEIKTAKITIPPHLRKRWSEMTDKELEEYRQLKGYKKGWKYHQKKLRTNSFLLSIGKSTGA